ncbi:MAG: DUF4124 domain-containing protein [Deltaproteobacteria bacterium]|nr:DUF4124 domain-containing protein [Deltaproteobacteria bacterium]
MARGVRTVVVLILMMGVSIADAEVYKWQDSNGVVHYSSKPTSQEAKPATLPKITRADVGIPSSGLVSCAKHGGIDCQAGPDMDGSVICMDGFTGATTRYRFHCSTPKLSISEVSDKTPEGTYKVVLRNAKAVKANQVSLFFERPDGKEVPLNGPAEVEPFGAAEYVLDKVDAEGLSSKPTIANLRFTCSNCP